jgi:Flp pilus assembly protein TadG
VSTAWFELLAKRARLRRLALPGLWSSAPANSGTAAIEFALVALILVPVLLNLVDFSFLIWGQMEVENAAEIGAQAAYNTCSPGPLPATTNCPTLNTVVTAAIHATSLANSVSLASGYPSETYYCTSGTSLQSVGSYSSPPSPFDCSAAGNAAATPGDYLTVKVTYSYTPLFSGLSLASAQTLTASGIQRLK